jgi:hypothetical protein
MDRGAARTGLRGVARALTREVTKNMDERSS